MENKTFYDCYCDYKRKGQLPSAGLCNSLPSILLRTDAWYIMLPTPENLKDLERENLPTIYWGLGSNRYHCRGLTPLRETILLLAACINKEY